MHRSVEVDEQCVGRLLCYVCVIHSGPCELACTQGPEVCTTSAAVLIAICNNTQCSGAAGGQDRLGWAPCSRSPSLLLWLQE